MNKNKVLIFFISYMLSGKILFAQSNILQTVRCIVTDKFTKAPLENVNISSPNQAGVGGTTNSLGEYEMQLPLGRYTFVYTLIGYNTTVSADVVINSGKQVILNVELEQKVLAANTATVKAKKTKSKALNELSIVSAKQFTVDEANRYAGALGDPARMAQNFAGVVTNGDRRNDIVIRGNSPLGLSWRLEGIEIPNPNHFSGVGTTGGSISILNNNNLSNSDFLTGAFAPQYGNATAGVFDLKLKNGNTKKHEHMFQFGFNGAELGSEGPISKKNNSSYIVNARYSTLELFTKLGINLGANATPRYQDYTIKLHYPTKKYGTIDVWSIGGYNTAVSLSKDYDTTGTKLNPRPKGFDTYFDNWMAVVGLTHQININKKTLSKLVITYNQLGNRTSADSLYNNETQKTLWVNRLYNESRLNLAYQLGYKWNAKHQTQIGAYHTRAYIDINDSILLTSLNRYVKILSFNGATNLSRAYAQHLYKINNNIMLVGGLHAMHLSLNSKASVEPRLAMQVQFNNKWSAQLGSGIHYQTQALTTYFYNRTGLGNFVDSLTNLNLDFTKSKHLILGTHYNMNANFHAKLEAYMQWLSQVPIQNKSTSFSTLNDGAFYYNTTQAFLINTGLGFNRGVELTLEKFFSKHYYFLITSSIYKSTYKGGDNIWRSTAFNGGYSLSTLGGYEFTIHKKNTLNINVKLAWLGGRPYSPIDTLASQLFGDTRFQEANAYTLKFPNYFRPDVKIGYRLNAKKYSQEFSLNIDNIINNQNVQSIEYDKLRNKVGYSYQVGIFPIVQYRIEF